jgi:predicted nucleic acid-binding protein
MTAVTDTTPICYLVLIGEINLLPALFETMLIPSAVLAELLHPCAPTLVQTWASSLPAWISVKDAGLEDITGMENLQAGERGAIRLAESIKADVILLDEKSARTVAGRRGLRITGTIGLLTEGADRGLIDLPVAINRLKQTNFRFSPSLLKSALDRTRPQ